MKPIQKFLQESVWHSKPMNEVVNDKYWQKVRSSLKGMWSENANKACSILRKYVGDMKDVRKVRQVMNYLTGTYFRTNKNPKCAIRLRNDLKEAKKKYKEIHMENTN